MSKNKKRLLAALLACVMTAAMVTGCTPAASDSVDPAGTPESKADDASKDEPKGAPTKLTFYIPNTPSPDEARVMDKANAIIEEKINANLEIVKVATGYGDKINLMINAGDAFDLAFVSNWAGDDYWGNVAKGAYADLTDLIPKLAPETYARIPESLWDGVKYNGKIYATVNYQQWGVAARKGYAFRKDIAEEVGFDWKALKGKPANECLKLMIPYLEAAIKKHPEMIGWETTNLASSAFEPLYYDMESVGDQWTPGWVKYSEPTKVINQWETPEFEEYCNIMREYYTKKLVRQDGATLVDANPDRKAGKILAQMAYGWPDTLDAEAAGVVNANMAAMSMLTPDVAPAISVSITRTVIPAGAGSTAAVAVNAKSPNIEKSVEMIELLNTNDELFFLITQGEKDVDFNFVDDDPKPIEGKYTFNFAEYTLGQSYSPTFARATIQTGEKGEKQKKNMQIVYDADKTAEASPMSGFVFDPASVKTQLANCDSIFQEMIPSLNNGALDPAKALPNFRSRLKDAGVDEVIAEKQKQIDAWVAAK